MRNDHWGKWQLGVSQHIVDNCGKEIGGYWYIGRKRHPRTTGTLPAGRCVASKNITKSYFLATLEEPFDWWEDNRAPGISNVRVWANWSSKINDFALNHPEWEDSIGFLRAGRRNQCINLKATGLFANGDHPGRFGNGHWIFQQDSVAHWKWNQIMVDDHHSRLSTMLISSFACNIHIWKNFWTKGFPFAPFSLNIFTLFKLWLTLHSKNYSFLIYSFLICFVRPLSPSLLTLPLA